MTAAARNALRAGMLLLLLAVIVTVLLTTVFEAVRPMIESNKGAAQRLQLDQVFPASLHDNDLMAAPLYLSPDERLGTHAPSVAWVARKRGAPVGVVLEAIAPDGYGGEIALLIGIDAQGVVTGVRVTAHHETPGLADYIEIAKSRWITQFNGKSLTAPIASAWKVRMDGGEFDARTGATITPRAVVSAVHSALAYFGQRRSHLLRGAAS